MKRGPVVSVATADQRVAVARFGEGLAARFLTERGARLLGRNVRVGRGEIDLHVMFDSGPAAVEVKTRVRPAPGFGPLGAYGKRKAAAVRRHARLLDPPAYRVDLVAVTIGTVGVDVLWIPYAS